MLWSDRICPIGRKQSINQRGLGCLGGGKPPPKHPISLPVEGNRSDANAVFHLTDYIHLWYHATRNLHPAYIELT